jgi:hypothetical protein
LRQVRWQVLCERDLLRAGVDGQHPPIAGDKQNHPDTKTEYKIAKQEWEELQQLIDKRVLAAFLGRIGCPGCADEGLEWAEVQFSDGTKKSVSYSTGKAPTAIVELLKKIQVIAAKYLPQQSVIC